MGMFQIRKNPGMSISSFIPKFFKYSGVTNYSLLDKLREQKPILEIEEA